jgi:hypothetical protein
LLNWLCFYAWQDFGDGFRSSDLKSSLKFTQLTVLHTPGSARTGRNLNPQKAKRNRILRAGYTGFWKEFLSVNPPAIQPGPAVFCEMTLTRVREK